MDVHISLGVSKKREVIAQISQEFRTLWPWLFNAILRTVTCLASKENKSISAFVNGEASCCQVAVSINFLFRLLQKDGPRWTRLWLTSLKLPCWSTAWRDAKIACMLFHYSRTKVDNVPARSLSHWIALTATWLCCVYVIKVIMSEYQYFRKLCAWRHVRAIYTLLEH